MPNTKQKEARQQTTIHTPPPQMLGSTLLKLKEPTFREGGSTLTMTLWLYMHTVQRNMLPFMSVHKPSPDISFIYLLGVQNAQDFKVHLSGWQVIIECTNVHPHASRWFASNQPDISCS